MRIQAKLWHRFVDIAGTACVIAALALLTPGVRTVRADDEPLMSVDPALAAAAARAAEKAEASPAAPSPASAPRSATSSPPRFVAGSPASPAATFPTFHGDDVENASRPGVSGIEIQPGVVVLNTRGFNYGPPPTPLAPEALKRESAPR